MKLLTIIIAFLACSLFASETKPVEESKNASPNYEQFFFEKLEKYTEKGEQTLDIAVDTLEKEVPLVVNEYLNWKFWESAANIIMILLGLAVYFFVVWFLIKKTNFKMFEVRSSLDFFGTVGNIIIGTLLLVLTPIVVYKNTKTCLQISIAPKVYLIERASEILKR